MRIDIQARGFDLTEGLREHTVRRLQFALGWSYHDVRSVSVRLFDINGPRAPWRAAWSACASIAMIACPAGPPPKPMPCTMPSRRWAPIDGTERRDQGDHRHRPAMTDFFTWEAAQP